MRIGLAIAIGRPSKGASLPLPVITSVTLDRMSPTVSPPDVIAATVVGTNITTKSYVWKAAGVTIGGETGDTYQTTRADAMGKAITCTAIGHNSTGDSSPVTSDPTALVTGAPVNTVAPLNQCNGLAGPNGPAAAALDTMAVNDFGGNVGTWTGYPTQGSMTFAYQWHPDGSITTPQYAPGAGAIGSSGYCTVSADNGIGGSAVQADSNGISVVAS